MQRCGCDFHASDKAKITVKLRVVFVTVMHLAMLYRERAITVEVAKLFGRIHNRLSFLFRVMSFSSQISSYKRSILDDSNLNRVTLALKLPLKSIPNPNVQPCFLKFFPHVPHCGEIRDSFQKSKKIAEGKLIIS